MEFLKNLFKKQRPSYQDPVEQTFSIMIKLVKDLPKADYNRLKKAMDLGWQSYQTVRNVKTEDERDTADIDESDRILTKESQK